jgi:DUF4097 and DUF4098 domain-containing protein YvlB
MRNFLIVAALFCVAPALCPGAGAGEEQEWTKSTPADQGGKLVARIDIGTIRVSGWDRNEVLVRARGYDRDDLDRLRLTRTGRTVTVTFDADNGPVSEGSLDIQVPVSFDLDLTTSAGELTIEGPLTGTLRGSTAGGNLRIGDVGGVVHMSTAGGDISAGTIKGDVRLTTAGGNVRTADITGQAEITTAGGDIRLGTIGNILEAETAGGNVTFGSVGKEATVATAGGSIQGGPVRGSATLTTAGGNITLDSGSGVVEATTAGGSISVGRVTGVLKASTAGGDITATLLPDGKSPSNLTTAGGSITLELPGDARATVLARIKDVERWGEDSSGPYNIRSDFPAESRRGDGRTGRLEVTITINGGGPRIELETAAGDVVLKRIR